MTRVYGRSLWIIAVVAASAFALAACAKAPAPADEPSLRALDAAYVEAWLNDDATRQEKQVLALFDRDAVIMPGGGLPPENGIRDLKNFWFPDGASPTIVTHFRHDIGTVEVSGDLGVVSGRYTLSFTYENQSIAQAGNYMIVARNGAGGWRIKKMIWNDQPLTDV
jgi:ketosteroid isomerase-like protein